MLEYSDFKVYVQSAPTHLGAGFRNPNHKSTNRVLVRCVLFLRPKFMVGCAERRYAPSVYLVAVFLTLYSLPPSCLETNGGSSQNSQEDTIMDDVRNAVWLFSQLSDQDQQFILIFLQTWIEFKEANNGH